MKIQGLGYDRQEFAELQTASDRQVSERGFNLLFSGTLLWGFLLNFILVAVLQRPIYRMLYRAQDGNSGVIFMGVLLVGYIVLCVVGSRMLRATSTVTNFVGFNLISLPVGILLSTVLAAYVNNMTLVYNALLLTLAATVIMMTLSMLFPQFFDSIGHTLGISLLGVLLVEGIAVLFFPRLFTILDYIVAGLMCLYIGFDWGRVATVPRTPRNAIAVAASLYLDIINLFIRLLAILKNNDN